MFKAYFDESGTSRDRTGLTVAGVVSSLKKWLRLEEQWQEILSRYGVKLFHMNDCAAGRSEFIGWSSEDRKSLISDLSECMARNVKYAWSCNIVLDCWKSINEEFMLRERLGTPYCFGAALCVFAVKTWNHKSRSKSPIEYIFEDGAEGRGEMIERVYKLHGVTPILEPKGLPGPSGCRSDRVEDSQTAP